MKTFYLTAILILFVSVRTVSAQCPPGDVMILTTSDVEAFAAQYPNCTEIFGDLTIGNELSIFEPPTPILSLAGFQNLEIVHGNLIIQYISDVDFQLCMSLNGLHNIHYAGGLKLHATTICDFQGLSSLSHIGPLGLIIHGVSGFMTFDGFNNLTSIDGGFRYNNCSDNVGTNFVGFDNLTSVGGLFTVFSNYALESFAGLENLQYIGGNFAITDMAVLTSLSGLEGLLYIGGNTIEIWGNDQLSFCGIPFFCNNPTLSGYNYSIGPTNLVGCNTLNQIVSTCANYSNYSGKLFADMNCNGEINPSEAFIPYYLILANSVPFTFSSNNGNYSGYLPPNSNVQLSSNVLGFSNGLIEVQTPETPQTFQNVNIGLCPDSVFANVSVTISPYWSLPRPGFTNSYKVCVQNLGSVETGANVSLDITSLLEWGNLISFDGGTLNGNEINWSIGNLELFEQNCFTVNFQTNASTPLGTLYELNANVEATNNDYIDYVLDDNYHEFSHTVIGSYDPNDKQVNITNIDVADLEDLEVVELEYLIRFQNTGTSYATFVRVIDELPAELNPASIQMISASHDYSLNFVETNKLDWFFDDIFLADSTTNEPESHGYIHFRISTHPNLVVDESINNRVSIYFDYNAPVITNYAITNIGQCVNVPEVNILIDGTNLIVDVDGTTYEWFLNGQPIIGASDQSFVPELSGNYSVTVTLENGCEVTSDLMMVSVSVGEELADKIHLFPNPSNENVTLDLPQGNWQVSFTDITGKTLLENHNLTQGRHNINLNTLSDGLYLIRISSESGSVVKKMMVNN